MNATNSAGPQTSARQTHALLTIVWIGLVAATLDIGYNLIYNSFRSVTPAMVFRLIASGLVGVTRAVQMGAAGVALGVVIHYSIAMTWTVLFYAASRKIAVLWRRPVISGLLYGCVVFVVMNFVVLPLSNVPHLKRHFTLFAWFYVVFAPLLFCIGLTISLLMKKFAPPPAARHG
ncbi:MAG: hypothetical protein KGL59_12440 [Acidobacteriota bacterium]|nr:hypothetical protein [Acidobacteriota bacterium]